jgi:uncharacterized integral membrane protein
MKWLTKLIITFLLAMALVVALKYNNTTIAIFTNDTRVDFSLTLVMIVLFILGFILIYGVGLLKKLKPKYKNK